tara:strand:+ start:264 stop:860 length:597 start_codon:yes stop_codon:yes gene_type:complete
MKVNPSKDIIQINGKIIKKFIFMLDALLANKPKIKITTFYNPQKQKALLDFLLSKFQKRSFLISRIDFLRGVVSLLKNEGVIHHQGGHPKFHYKKKYIVKINSLKDDKKFIKWRNEIKLDNKFIHPYSIKTIKQKIEYIIFKVIFNKGRDRRFIGKLNLLGYKVLELKIVSFWEISLGSFKEGDLKLFNKFVFKDILL